MEKVGQFPGRVGRICSKDARFSSKIRFPVPHPFPLRCALFRVSLPNIRTPVTLAFYYTIELVIEELFNCAPGATSASKSQHMDGIAARLETGIFGSVAGYLGVIEAQMRKMLH